MSKLSSSATIIAKRVALSLACVGLVACSGLKLAYDNLPTLSYWWLDDYFDISQPQSAPLKTGLANLHQWHITTELPQITPLLGEIAEKLSQPITAQQVCAWGVATEPHVYAVTDAAAVMAAPLLTRLSPKQLAHFDAAVKDKNDEWRDDWLNAKPEKLSERRLERTVDNLERFYGDLSNEQTETIAAALARQPFNFNDGWQRRLRNQGAFRSWLVAHSQSQGTASDSDTAAQNAATVASLQALWRVSITWPDDYRARLCQQIADFHDLMTPAQRTKAQAVMAGYQSDFQALADAGAAVSQ